MNSAKFCCYLKGYLDILAEADSPLPGFDQGQVALLRRRLASLSDKGSKDESAKEFTNWLSGFLDALGEDVSLSAGDVEKIEAKLDGCIKIDKLSITTVRRPGASHPQGRNRRLNC